MKVGSKVDGSKARRLRGHVATERNRNAHNFHDPGFSLIELVVVIAMILVLLSIALPMYNKSIQRAREAKLHQNLTTLNKVIQEYSLDKKHAPQQLEDMVPGYLKFIPDDITGRNDTWKVDQEDPQDAWDANQTGIVGVHSGSDEISSDGSAYSSWTH